jgi:riboflavin synthase
MFTGIIQAIGKVVKSDGHRLWIRCPFRRIRLGESISVEGVCLTVAAQKKGALAFDVGSETRRVTTHGRFRVGRRVNLERSLRVGERLGGHWVSGHVEETGRILRIQKAKRNWWFTFSLPKVIRRFVVSKGSLAIDGISLTVAFVKKNQARVMIIPHTLSHTTLSDKKEGDAVNLEPDLLAKYALRRHP